MNLSQLAAQLALPKTHANPNEVNDILTRLRAEEPVIRIDPDGVRPLWLVTRSEDIKHIETHPDDFLAAPRTGIQLEIHEQKNIELFGRVQGSMPTLVEMDGEHHRSRRLLTQGWFGPSQIKSQTGLVNEIAESYVNRMATLQPTCDFVTDIAVYYPLRVINAIIGLPEKDDDTFLRLTQQMFGAADEGISNSNEQIRERLGRIYMDFHAIFAPIIEDRRNNPKDDLATILANAEINGEKLPDEEVLGYFLIIATAGHDTTSATTAGALQALIEHPEQLKKLKENLDLIPNAVEEFLRWVAPVKNFVRTASRDIELGGKTIKKGEDLAVMFASAGRDEGVIENPFEFRVDREKNAHLSFGTGPHLCLGMHLARMEVAAFFQILLPRLDEVEIVGSPAYVESAFVTGLKSLPIRFKMN